MRKFILIAIGLLFGAALLHADVNPYILGTVSSSSGGGSSPSGFCTGGELFCRTFEGDEAAWDSSNGTSDCDGYDTNGDYCDDDITTYKEGSEAFGIMGGTSYYVRKTLSSTSEDDLYVEFWWRTPSYVGGVCHPIVLRNSGGYDYVYIGANWGTLQVGIKGGASALSTSETGIAASTWYHIGVYYKAETGDGSNNDGIVRVWRNTDGGTFDAGDLVLNNTAADNGAFSEGWNLYTVSLQGCLNSYISYLDNVSVKAGAPSWTYE